MFGYCDNERCLLDLWAPEGGALTNRAFSGYAMMMSNIDNVVDEIVEEVTSKYYMNGFTEDMIEVSLPSNLTDWEIEYVSQKVREKLRSPRW